MKGNQGATDGVACGHALEQLTAGFGRAAQRLGGAALAPATLVSVSRIFREGYLVELDVTAVAS